MSDVMQLVGAVGTFIAAVAAFVSWLGQALLPWLPGGLWCAWWLWCVNWKHAWPVLARGGWIVVVLLTLVSALAWSGIFPRSCDCLGFPLANFWWQLGACTTLALVALFCGWLQGRWGLTPSEVDFEPVEHHDDHGHGHGHAHEPAAHAVPSHGGHH
jgi:hypothetical protein